MLLRRGSRLPLAVAAPTAAVARGRRAACLSSPPLPLLPPGGYAQCFSWLAALSGATAVVSALGALGAVQLLGLAQASGIW